MKLQCELRVEDLVAYNLDCLRRNQASERRAAWKQVLIIGGSILLVLSFYSSWRQTGWPVLAGLVFFVFWVLLLYRALRPRAQADRLRRYFEAGAQESLLGAHELTIQENSLKVVMNGVVSEYAWPSIRRIAETDRHYFLELDRAIALIVPKETVREGNLTEFVQAVRERTRSDGDPTGGAPDVAPASPPRAEPAPERVSTPHSAEKLFSPRELLVLSYGGLVLLLLLFVAIAALLISQAMAANKTLKELTALAVRMVDAYEDNIDDHIDSGYEDPSLAAGEPLLAKRVILLGHTINSRTAKDVCGRLLCLDAADPAKGIDLYISSQGGWEDNAFAIVQTMRRIRAPVHTHALGGCYSSGALILAAGTGRRTATEDTILMIHANATESKDPYSFGRLSAKRYEKLFRKTARLPADWFPLTSNKSYYLNAEEALQYGLIDDIVPIWPVERETPPR